MEGAVVCICSEAWCRQNTSHGHLGHQNVCVCDSLGLLVSLVLKKKNKIKDGIASLRHLQGNSKCSVFSSGSTPDLSFFPLIAC